MRGAECSIVEARARKPMSLGLLGLHQGSEHRFRSRVAATFRMLFREVASRHPSALLLAFCPDLDRASETGDGGRRGAVLGVRGGLFWQWACGASPVLVTGVTLREPRKEKWQFAEQRCLRPTCRNRCVSRVTGCRGRSRDLQCLGATSTSLRVLLALPLVTVGELVRVETPPRHNST